MTPKFFKSSLNIAAGEFKNYFPVNVNLRYETIAPHLVLVEQNYIKPIIGQALFNSLAAYYAQHIEVNDQFDEVLDMIRFSEIRLALWKGFDSIQFYIMKIIRHLQPIAYK